MGDAILFAPARLLPNSGRVSAMTGMCQAPCTRWIKRLAKEYHNLFDRMIMRFCDIIGFPLHVGNLRQATLRRLSTTT